VRIRGPFVRLQDRGRPQVVRAHHALGAEHLDTLVVAVGGATAVVDVAQRAAAGLAIAR
jgi:hypothetical protein